MTAYNYCSPEWLEESAKRYSENTALQNKLHKLSSKMCFRVTADISQGLDEDIIFAAYVQDGSLMKLCFVNEAEAKDESDYILAASPQEWSQILRKKQKFIARFMMQEVKLEQGEKVDVLKLAPYTNELVDVLTQVNVRYSDEMSAAEIEDFRIRLNGFRQINGV